MGIITWLIDKILQALDIRTQIKVLVHEAFFDFGGPINESHYFIKIINLSPTAVFTITHVWAKDGGREIDIRNLDTPLPYTLGPSEVWETWLKKSLIKDQINIFENVRAVLSNGKEYRSKKNTGVRPIGLVANRK